MPDYTSANTGAQIDASVNGFRNLFAGGYVGNATLTGNATISGTLGVTGGATFGGASTALSFNTIGAGTGIQASSLSSSGLQVDAATDAVDALRVFRIGVGETFRVDGNGDLTTAGAATFSGAVGVGIAPAYDLHVYDTDVSQLGVTRSGGLGVILGSDTSSGEYVGTLGASAFKFLVNSAVVGQFDASGNLLVGTSAPISGTALTKAYVYNNTASKGAFQVAVGPSHTGGFAIGALSTVQAASSVNLALVIQSGNGSSVTTNNLLIRTNGNLTNTNNSYGAISDRKLKENIADANSQWADFKLVRFRKYSLIADGSPKANQLGVVAQELEDAGMESLVNTVPDIEVVTTITQDEEGNDVETSEAFPTGTFTKDVKYSILTLKAHVVVQELQHRTEVAESLAQQQQEMIESITNQSGSMALILQQQAELISTLTDRLTAAGL